MLVEFKSDKYVILCIELSLCPTVSNNESMAQGEQYFVGSVDICNVFLRPSTFNHVQAYLLYPNLLTSG